MSAAQPTTTTLAGALWPARTNPLPRAVALMAAGVILLTISAKVYVPFWPVHMTLQTLVVALIGAAFGARLGAATVLAYLATGLLGAPVFTNTPPAVAGPLYFLGATGGYLLAYPVAAWIVGIVAERVGNRIVPLFGAMFLADVVVLSIGFAWLAFLAQLSTGAWGGVGIARAWVGGVEPFLLGDLVKVSLGAALVAAGWKGVKKLRG